MQFPDWIIEIATKFSEDYGCDIPEAAELAYVKIKRHPQYQNTVDMLIRKAIKDLVYQQRHASNVAMKRQVGSYNTADRTNTAGSQVVNRVYRSTYNYYIRGKTLGDLLGRDLQPLIESEDGIAKGHIFNARLLSWVASQRVGEDVMVKSVIREAKLRANFDRIYKEVYGTET